LNFIEIEWKITRHRAIQPGLKVRSPENNLRRVIITMIKVKNFLNDSEKNFLIMILIKLFQINHYSRPTKKLPTKFCFVGTSSIVFAYSCHPGEDCLSTIDMLDSSFSVEKINMLLKYEFWLSRIFL